MVHGVTKSQTWLSDWTELNWSYSYPSRQWLWECNNWRQYDMRKHGLEGFHSVSLLLYPDEYDRETLHLMSIARHTIIMREAWLRIQQPHGYQMERQKEHRSLMIQLMGQNQQEAQLPLNFLHLKCNTFPSDCVLVAQSCLTLCDPMDCSLPGSSVHGILQARILQGVAISFSRGFSQPRDWTLDNW